MNQRCAAALELLRERGRGVSGNSGRLFLRKGWRHLSGKFRHRSETRYAERIRGTFQSHSIVNIVLDVPAFHGLFEVKADSSLALILMQGHFEEDALALLSRLVQPDDQVIDVGANVGLFSVYLASLVGSRGRVLAVEPSPAILPCLRSNLVRNNAVNVLLHEGLLAEKDGEREFNSVDASPEYSSIGMVVHPHAPKEITTVTVGGTTLDALVDRHGLKPSFIKMDVEGAEGLVLAGARETLRMFRPAILSEVDDRLLQTLGYTSSCVFKSFEDSGYHIFNVADGAELESSCGGSFIGSVLALPAEHLGRG